MNTSRKYVAPMWGSDNYVSCLSQDDILMPYQDVIREPIPQFQNGRVIGLSEVKGNEFQMFTANDNDKNNTKNTILYGTFSRSNLSDTFFSNANMDVLQNMIRYNVYISSGGEFKIGKQDNTELTIIMRSIYLMHSKNLPDNIPEQINELNHHVVTYILPKLLSEIKQYLFYTKDIQQLPMPLDHPKNLSSRGTKTLSSTVGIL